MLREKSALNADGTKAESKEAHQMRVAQMNALPILWKVPEWAQDQEKNRPIDLTHGIRKKVKAPIEFSKQTAKT